MRDRQRPVPRASTSSSDNPPIGSVRIIGGKMRGRIIPYSGDERTRPMKDRVREAIFNLIGPEIQGKIAIDLFAGTGVVGMEAVSRGAIKAIFIERHFPTAKSISRAAEQLQVEDQVTVSPGDTFVWSKRIPELGEAAWVVFCSPPYEFYTSRTEEMLAMLDRLEKAAPAGSIFVIEADERFDMTLLSKTFVWDVRTYLPAVVAVGRK